MSTTPSFVGEAITLTVPARTEFVGVVRLTIAGVAGRMDFTIEQIEDIKIAVSEAVTNCVQYAYPHKKVPGRIDIRCEMLATGLCIVIQDFGQGFDTTLLENATERKSNSKLGLGLGITFIRSLMDTVSVTSETNTGTVVTMTKLLNKL